MKRGLKLNLRIGAGGQMAVEENSPMKRGLKFSSPIVLGTDAKVEENSPMKRGLKSSIRSTDRRLRFR